MWCHRRATFTELRDLDAFPPLENRAFMTPRDGIPRQVVRTTVTIRNMTSRGLAAF